MAVNGVRVCVVQTDGRKFRNDALNILEYGGTNDQVLDHCADSRPNQSIFLDVSSVSVFVSLHSRLQIERKIGCRPP